MKSSSLFGKSSQEKITDVILSIDPTKRIDTIIPKDIDSDSREKIENILVNTKKLFTLDIDKSTRDSVVAESSKMVEETLNQAFKGEEAKQYELIKQKSQEASVDQPEELRGQIQEVTQKPDLKQVIEAIPQNPEQKNTKLSKEEKAAEKEAEEAQKTNINDALKADTPNFDIPKDIDADSRKKIENILTHTKTLVQELGEKWTEPAEKQIIKNSLKMVQKILKGAGKEKELDLYKLIKQKAIETKQIEEAKKTKKNEKEKSVVQAPEAALEQVNTQSLAMTPKNQEVSENKPQAESQAMSTNQSSADNNKMMLMMAMIVLTLVAAAFVGPVAFVVAGGAAAYRNYKNNKSQNTKIPMFLVPAQNTLASTQQSGVEKSKEVLIGYVVDDAIKANEDLKAAILKEKIELTSLQQLNLEKIIAAQKLSSNISSSIQDNNTLTPKEREAIVASIAKDTKYLADQQISASIASNVSDRLFDKSGDNIVVQKSQIDFANKYELASEEVRRLNEITTNLDQNLPKQEHKNDLIAAITHGAQGLAEELLKERLELIKVVKESADITPHKEAIKLLLDDRLSSLEKERGVYSKAHAQELREKYEIKSPTISSASIKPELAIVRNINKDGPAVQGLG